MCWRRQVSYRVARILQPRESLLKLAQSDIMMAAGKMIRPPQMMLPLFALLLYLCHSWGTLRESTHLMVKLICLCFGLLPSCRCSRKIHTSVEGDGTLRMLRLMKPCLSLLTPIHSHSIKACDALGGSLIIYEVVSKVGRRVCAEGTCKGG